MSAPARATFPSFAERLPLPREASSRLGSIRRALLDAGIPLYNGAAKWIHCRGLGTCGTCALRVTGALSPPTRVEAWRLRTPPHRAGSGLRLACQCAVLGDVVIEKLPGLWGQGDPP